MGYCYTKSGGLVCDCCGAEGARKCTCPHRVYYANGSSLPYCPAPALCSECLKRNGGALKIHAGCQAPAAACSDEEAKKREKATKPDRGTDSRLYEMGISDADPGL